MIGFLERLCGAVATAEGYFNADGSVNHAVPAGRNDNPGNLRASPWLLRPLMHGFVDFGGPEEGIAGLYHQLALDVSRGLTLDQLIRKYAPASDHNDTANYIAETARRMHIDPHTKLWFYLEIARVP